MIPCGNLTLSVRDGGENIQTEIAWVEFRIKLATSYAVNEMHLAPS
jgi:hypothetical protein